jgi:hypothetical protein
LDGGTGVFLPSIEHIYPLVTNAMLGGVVQWSNLIIVADNGAEHKQSPLDCSFTVTHPGLVITSETGEKRRKEISPLIV